MRRSVAISAASANSGRPVGCLSVVVRQPFRGERSRSPQGGNEARETASDAVSLVACRRVLPSGRLLRPVLEASAAFGGVLSGPLLVRGPRFVRGPGTVASPGLEASEGPPFGKAVSLVPLSICGPRECSLPPDGGPIVRESFGGSAPGTPASYSSGRTRTSVTPSSSATRRSMSVFSSTSP